MAISIKTDEADRLARELARLTGETVTEAVTRALRERLERERARTAAVLPARIAAFAARVRPLFDTRPVTQAEWDAACDDPILSGARTRRAAASAPSRQAITPKAQRS